MEASLISTFTNKSIDAMAASSSSTALQASYKNYQFILVVFFPLVFFLLVRKRVLSTTRRLSSSGLNNETARENDNKVVLITGADTGFGSIEAANLVELGYCVFAGCLNADKTAASERFMELNNRFPDRFHVVQMDVTKDDQVQAAMETVSAWFKENPSFRLYSIVNNAGITYPMVPLELCSMTSFHNIIDINVYGALRVIKAFLPLLRQSGKRDARIVVMASLAGEFGCPMMSAYCASKWALIAISDTLRYELSRFGIAVSVVLPDLYRTQLVTNQSLLTASLDRELTRMDGNVLNAYGGNTGVQQMRRFIELMEEHANPNLAPVIDAITEAVCAKSPKRRYYPISWKSAIATSIARWCPWLIDNLVTISQRPDKNSQQLSSSPDATPQKIKC